MTARRYVSDSAAREAALEPVALALRALGYLATVAPGGFLRVEGAPSLSTPDLYAVSEGIRYVWDSVAYRRPAGVARAVARFLSAFLAPNPTGGK